LKVSGGNGALDVGGGPPDSDCFDIWLFTSGYIYLTQNKRVAAKPTRTAIATSQRVQNFTHAAAREAVDEEARVAILDQQGWMAITVAPPVTGNRASDQEPIARAVSAKSTGDRSRRLIEVTPIPCHCCPPALGNLVAVSRRCSASYRSISATRYAILPPSRR
jgi:hypothetical protein